MFCVFYYNPILNDGGHEYHNDPGTGRNMYTSYALTRLPKKIVSDTLGLMIQGPRGIYGL